MRSLAVSWGTLQLARLHGVAVEELLRIKIEGWLSSQDSGFSDVVVRLQQRLLSKSEHSLMELEGLGKEIWQGLDAQDYVEQERASWNDKH